MSEPWDLKTDDAREADTIYTFLIFTEDETSEVEYFNWFETDTININIIPKQKSMIHNVVKALTYCQKNGIIDENNNVVDGYEIWCVYDRDKSNINPLENNNRFNIAHQIAKEREINLAWSNDAFELWILMHLMEIDLQDEEFKHRDKYYDLLTEYFRNHPNPNERLTRILAHPSYSYKKDMKHRTNFREVVRPEILPYTNLAIERSEGLFEHFKNTGTTNYDEWAPCTLVHLLVKRLLEVGGKAIPNIS